MYTTATTDNIEWTVLEKLLLTQAVYKYGENMWFQVARVLKAHGLIQPNQRQSDFFSQKNCQFQYYLLVQNLEAEKQVYRSIDLQNDMPVVVKIARQLYLQRVEEVKAELKRDEEKFGQLVREIELIKSGQWDEKLKAELSPEDREAMEKEVALNRVEKEDLVKKNDAVGESTSNGQGEYIASIATTSSLPASVIVGKNGKFERLLAHQDTSMMKRTSSETTIISLSSSKRFRPEDSNIDPSHNSNEDQVISTAISAAANISNSNNTYNALIYQETESSQSVEDQIPNEFAAENASIPAQIIATEMTPLPVANSDCMSRIEVGIENGSYSAANMSVTALTRNAQYADATQVFTANDIPVTKASEPSTTNNPQQQSHNQELEKAITQYTEQQPHEILMHAQNGQSSQSQEQPLMSAAHQLPKIIIPDASSSSSLSYYRFYQDQSASPISKLYNTDSNNHSIMTPDEEDFSAHSETATPTSTTSAIERRRNINSDQRQKAWQKNVYLLWQEIANHKNGTIFMNPIKKAHAPLYDKVVKQPLYLKTIKNRVRDGIVRTTAEFERDIVLMLTNSLMYNKEGTETYQMALEMLDDVREQFRLFKSADGYWEYD